jgi:hypothetical protein
VCVCVCVCVCAATNLEDHVHHHRRLLFLVLAVSVPIDDVNNIYGFMVHTLGVPAADLENVSSALRCHRIDEHALAAVLRTIPAGGVTITW